MLRDDSIEMRLRTKTQSMLRPSMLAGNRIHLSHDAEINEAVIDRRDQSIGQRMGETGQIGVEARRVDDDEVGASLDLAHGLPEQIELDAMIFTR
jgi:hypothetical protein